MASLPPVVVGNTIKLDPEFKKSSSPSLTFQKKNYSAKELGKAFDSFSLEFREALSLIREGNRKLESSCYVPLLQECLNKKSASWVETIHAHMIKSGFCQELFLMTTLVDVYAKCGMMGSAQKVFNNLRERNVIAWTSLMFGYVHNSQPAVVISIFKEMLAAGVYPTDYTLGGMLNACVSLCDIGLGKQIHGHVVKYDLEHYAAIGNTLCSFYSKCCDLDMVIKAFRRIEEKDLISWGTVISACGNNGNSSMGLDMFVEMLVEGFKPHEFTLTSVLSLCRKMEAIDMGSQVHALSIKLGYGSVLRVMNLIMFLYLKGGCINEAKKLFDGMNTINLVAWNAIIAGHAEITSHAGGGLLAYSYGVEALRIFQRMDRSGLRPDQYTFSSVLTICSSLVALEQGEQVHAQTIKAGCLSDVVVGTAVVNMYNKCGSIDQASKAFVEMPTRTSVSWATTITAFAKHGRSQQALQLFEDMRFVGVRPNKIAFVGVLLACDQAGLVDEALAYYDMMKNEYMIDPVVGHHTCIIDMFVRLGQINEAFDFIKRMDLTPNEFIWSILIQGCKSQGKLELGFYAAEQVLQLIPQDSETYCLLLNMYHSAGRWKDVSRIRKMMRDEKIGRITDWSWITIRNKVYSFKSSPKNHKPDEVTKHLEDLIDRLRVLGYRVETNLNTADEATELPVNHSEKLAVSFGLINTSNETQIRVIKNMAICRDCHSFMKVVSILTSRTIVVKDSRRLHKFCSGQCSCGDFGGLV